MGKGKMSLLDVREMVKELEEKLIGLRVANIYHLNSRTYLLKLSGLNNKQYLLLESGVRLHTTGYHRDHDHLPNMFATKLRKHIRMLRLERIVQLGVDRVVQFTFGSTHSRCYHLMLEMYAQGNIVLCNADYEILMVLRIHQFSDPHSMNQQQQQQQEQQEDESTIELEEERLVDEENFAEIEAKGKAKEIQLQSSNATSIDRVAVRSVYPHHRAQQEQQQITRDMILNIIREQRTKQKEEEEKMRKEEEQQLRTTTAGTGANEESQQGDGNKQRDDHDENQSQHQQKKKSNKQQSSSKSQSQSKSSSSSKSSRSRGSSHSPLKAVLSTSIHYGPDLIEHCLLQVGLDPNQPFVASEMDDEMTNKLVAAFKEAPGIMKKLAEESLKGWIVVRRETGQQLQVKKPKVKKRNRVTAVEITGAADGQASMSETPKSAISTAEPLESESQHREAATNDLKESSNPLLPAVVDRTSLTVEKKEDAVDVYSEYLCILLSQHSVGSYSPPECRLVEFPSLDAAMDEFYSKQEEQKEQIRLIKERAAALQKIERVRQSHEKQVSALAAQQQENDRKAQLIEMNLVIVEKCIESVNTELAQGTDWKELQTIIKQEKLKGNFIAILISNMKLEENTITLTLSADLQHLHPSFSYQNCTPGNRPLRVDIDLSLSAANNAQYYYQQRKKQSVKQIKTIEASEKALAAAERKTESALKEVDQRARIQKIRKVYWWEKFHWFISSENYLIIAGKDAQQNEVIVKRHLEKNDLYVHAEVHGASSVVIKNHSTVPIPPLTIQQAGTMCICRSVAWKGKVQTEAYWVYPDQVSKTAPSGMFLTTGSFMIRGKRNFISRMPMIMGLGILFRLDDSSIHKHVGERKVKGGAESTEAASPTQQPPPVAAEKLITEDDEDFDVTSQFVMNAAMNGADQGSAQFSSSDLSGESESESSSASNAPPSTSSIPPTAILDLYDKKDTGPKKRISAAEKRRMKKQQSDIEKDDSNSIPPNPTATIVSTVVDADNAEDDARSSNANPRAKKIKQSQYAASSTPAPSLSVPLSRTQRNKQKKILKKYGEQDEEDLLIAASVLGLQNINKQKKQIKEREQQQRGNKENREQKTAIEEKSQHSNAEQDQDEDEKELSAASSEADSADKSTATVDDVEKLCFFCKQKGHVFKNCPQKQLPNSTVSPSYSSISTGVVDPDLTLSSSLSSKLTFSKARREAKAVEEQELISIRVAENLNTIEAEEVADQTSASPLSLINQLTARPLPDDQLQFAIAVCCPYSILTDYKYKVKLLPGSGKKGKLSSAAIGLFVKQSGSGGEAEQERELLKNIRDEEVMSVLLGNCKIAAPGLHDSTPKKKKKGKKADE